MTTVTGTFTFTAPVGPAGPIGPAGIQGPVGPMGPVGPSPDINALAKAVAAILAGATPPVTSPPVSGTFWVYQNGTFNWTDHYSFNGTPNLYDTVGNPGKEDIAFTLTSRWGGYQPYLAAGFDTSPYKYLTYSIKPTVPNQIIATGFDANNDVKDGNIVVVAGPGITKYGPVPQVGVWATYKIPLADFTLTNPSVLKFSIADGLGDPAGTIIYMDNIGFSPA